MWLNLSIGFATFFDLTTMRFVVLVFLRPDRLVGLCPDWMTWWRWSSVCFAYFARFADGTFPSPLPGSEHPKLTAPRKDQQERSWDKSETTTGHRYQAPSRYVSRILLLWARHHTEGDWQETASSPEFEIVNALISGDPNGSTAK